MASSKSPSAVKAGNELVSHEKLRPTNDKNGCGGWKLLSLQSFPLSCLNVSLFSFHSSFCFF